LDKLEANNGSELTVVRINVDEEPGLAEDYSVSAIPALFLFKDGKPVKDWLGYAEASEFQESIDELK
jgi:thioredoxin-like negative regulator of GroEL